MQSLRLNQIAPTGMWHKCAAYGFLRATQGWGLSMIKRFFTRAAPRPNDSSPKSEAPPQTDACAVGGPNLAHFSRAGFGPAQIFEDIPILPAQFIDRTMYGGGPLWPDFARQIGPRHGRHGRPIDTRPPSPTGAVTEIPGAVAWGGQVYHHFGHQIADYASLIIQTRIERPDDPVLFLLRPDGKPEALPKHFYQIMDWLGLPKEQIVLINSAHRARRLYVAPQAEQLPDIGPSAGYLDALDANWHRHRLAPIDSEFLYVSRAAMLRTGAGGHAGERYLVERLQAAGASVLVPEQAPLRHQIRAYAGARHILFSEGSAMHGRQLLGHFEQSITVLNRRPLARTALHLLRPRCDELIYAEVVHSLLSMVRPDGTPRAVDALSLLEPSRLLDCLSNVGVDLHAGWDSEAYGAARDADILAWLEVKSKDTKTFDMDKSKAHLKQGLEKADLGHLLPDLDRIMAAQG